MTSGLADSLIVPHPEGVSTVDLHSLAAWTTVLATLLAMFATMSRNFSKLDVKIDTVHDKLDRKIDDRIDELRAEMRDGFSRTEARLNIIEQRTYDLSTRLQPDQRTG